MALETEVFGSSYPAPTEKPAEGPVQGPIHPGSGRRFSLRRLSGPVGAFAVLLAKFKGVLLLLPKLKLLATSGTMLVSVAAYSLIWGWTTSFSTRA